MGDSTLDTNLELHSGDPEQDSPQLLLPANQSIDSSRITPRTNYWARDSNYRKRVLVTLGPFEAPGYPKDPKLKISRLLPPEWADKISKLGIAYEPYTEREGYHYHYCISLKGKGIRKKDMYPAWWHTFPDCGIDIQVKYKVDDYLFNYIIIPDKDKILDENPYLLGTTKQEQLNRAADMKAKRTKGSLEQLEELEEAIAEGMAFNELAHLNNKTASLVFQNKLGAVIANVKKMQETGDRRIPAMDEWQPDVPYVDHYNKEATRFYLKEQFAHYRFKHGQLYIHGPPNTFKTTTLQQIAAEEGWRIFEATQSMREWVDFDPKSVDLILWDEFDPKQLEFNRMRLLKLLAGSSTSIDIKYGEVIPDLNLRTENIAVVFLSNFPPPADEAFLARIKEITCQEKVTECLCLATD